MKWHVAPKTLREGGRTLSQSQAVLCHTERRAISEKDQQTTRNEYQCILYYREDGRAERRQPSVTARLLGEITLNHWANSRDHGTTV